MKFCMECGTQLPARAKFCFNCGLQLTDQPAVHWDDGPEVLAPLDAPLPIAAPLPEPHAPVPQSSVAHAPVEPPSPWDAPVEPPAYEAPTYEPPTYEAPSYEPPSGPPVPVAPHAFREPYSPPQAVADEEPVSFAAGLPWETEERDDLVPPPASAYADDVDDLPPPPVPTFHSYVVDEPAPPFAAGFDVPNLPPDPLTLVPTPDGPKQQKNWFARHKLVTATTIVLCAVIIAAAVNSNNDPTSSTTATPTISAATSVNPGVVASPNARRNDRRGSPAVGGGDQQRTIGQAASIGGMEATVSSALFQQSVGAGQDEGYVVADVSYTNRSGATKPYNSLDWKLQTPQGTLTDVEFAGADGQLASGELTDGATTAGKVTFRVGMQKGTFTLVWTPQGIGSSRGLWSVPVS